MSLSRRRLRAVCFLVVVGFLSVSARLFYVQLWCHPVLASRAKKQFERFRVERPLRGSILDRNGEVLVRSVKVHSCFIDPMMVENPKVTSHRLAAETAWDEESLWKKIIAHRKRKSAFFWIARDLEADHAQRIRNMELRGVGFIMEQKRFYPNQDLARAILGKVGEDARGLTGIEYKWEKVLSGPPAKSRILRDGRGNRLFDPDRDSDPPLSGNVSLTLDRTIQYFAEKELDRGLDEAGAREGMIVVQNSNTGEILAMASRAKDRRALPRLSSITDAFEPGSTFKIIAAAAALNEGLVKVDDKIYCEKGSWEYKGVTIHDYTPQKELTFSEVIEKSSNICTAKVTLLLGPEIFYRYIRAFGFGTLSGIELPGETRGLVRPVKKWSGISLPMLSFGQEIGVSVIQLAGAYSAVANGGVLYEAKMIHGAELPVQGKTIYPPRRIRRAISTETARTLREILIRTVKGGTGRSAAMAKWTVAGKTGTAQKADRVKGGYATGKYIVSFAGFVPARHPRLTIVVIYDEPEGVAQGSRQAAPVFRRLAQEALDYLGVPSDRAPLSSS